MQSVLRLNSVEAGVMGGPTPRASKFLAAGAAIVTAGSLAATPIAPSVSLPALAQRAVQLAAIASPTASPLQVYQELFTNTFTNLQNFGEAFGANPFPVLSQIGANQSAYGADLMGAIEAIPANWKKFSEGTGTGTSGGATYLANLKKALAEGNTGAATTAASSYALYGMLATLQPIYGKLLTSTPRGSTTPVPGIPQKMALNFANAIGVAFSNTTWVSGIVESVYGATSGTIFAIGETMDEISKAAQAGNIGAAVNGLINLPAIAVDAVVNGWQHPAGQVSWPALLTYQDTGLRPTTSIGLLGQLGVKIPAAIAKSITPVTTTPAASVAAAASSPAVGAAAAASAPVAAPTVEVASTSTSVVASVAAPDTGSTAAPAAAAVAGEAEVAVEAPEIPSAAELSAPVGIAGGGTGQGSAAVTGSQDGDSPAASSGPARKATGGARHSRGKE